MAASAATATYWVESLRVTALPTTVSPFNMSSTVTVAENPAASRFTPLRITRRPAGVLRMISLTVDRAGRVTLSGWGPGSARCGTGRGAWAGAVGTRGMAGADGTGRAAGVRTSGLGAGADVSGDLETVCDVFDGAAAEAPRPPGAEVGVTPPAD